MNGVWNVRHFGATGDGQALDSPAIQRALDTAAVSGGRVLVPPGTYRCGTLELRSRVTLDLLPGAVLLGSPRLEDYTPHSWGHNKDVTRWQLIHAENVEHAAITGEGVIDGNGPAFWQPGRPHEWHFWVERTHRVSPMIQINRSRHVRLQGVTLCNTPGWTVHLRSCEHVAVDGLTLRNSLFGPNSDGLDVDGCRFVTIRGCDIETGDDAIVLKTTRGCGPCEFITVSDCVLRTSCVAFKLGTESWAPFRHITMRNCVVPSCSRAVSLISYDGALIEHVVVSGITGTTDSGWPVNRPIELYAVRRGRYDTHKLPRDHPDHAKEIAHPPVGRISGVTLRDIHLVTDGRMMLVADDDTVIENVTAENVRLDYVFLEDPAVLQGRGYLPGEHQDAFRARAAVVAKNVRNLRLRDLQVTWPRYPISRPWAVFTSPNRFFNRAFFEGREEQIQRGEHRPEFAVFCGRKARGVRVTGAPSFGSEGGPATDLAESDLTWNGGDGANG